MKKTIVLFIFALFLLLNLTANNVNIEASSTNINDLSYAGGKNLIDKENLQYENDGGGNITLTTINNIYLPESDDDEMVLQLDYNIDFIYAPTADLILYDINGIEIERYHHTTGYFNHYTVGDVDVIFTMFTIEDVEPFSFSFILTGLFTDFIGQDYPGFMMTHTYVPTEYEPFVKGTGLFELSSDSEATIFVNYPNVLSTNQVLSMIKANDAYNGDLSANLSFALNEYQNHESTLGRYKIIVSATDSSNNATFGQFYIEVVDIEAPVIEGNDVFMQPVYTDLTDDMILEMYNASDEYDGDISSGMEIVGEYTTNSTTIKTETIQIQVSDSSGNTATKTVIISFYDNVSPVITAPLSVTLSYQVRKTVENILADSVHVTDNLDNNPTLIITSNNYTGNENRIGNYSLSLKATDASGNETTKTILIEVEDKIKPVIYIDLGVVETLSSVILKVEDLSNILYRRGELRRNIKYRTEVLKDTYTGHESTPGTYALKVRYVSDDETIEKTFTIKVTESSYNVDTYTPKIDNITILFVSIVSALSLALIVLMIVLIVKSKKHKRYY